MGSALTKIEISMDSRKMRGEWKPSVNTERIETLCILMSQVTGCEMNVNKSDDTFFPMEPDTKIIFLDRLVI